VRRLVAIAVTGGLVIWGVAWLVPRIGVPDRFWLSPRETVSVGGRELHVVRVGYATGLRQVPSLGGLDGALFALDRAASPDHGMGMDSTLMPLDVAFFDADGYFIERFTMPVCRAEECPTYTPSQPWQFAIEAPAGALGWISHGAVLVR